MLQPPEVGVLRRDLDRPQRRLDLADRGGGFGQRAGRRLVLLVDAVNARERVANLARRVALEDVDGKAAALRLAQAVWPAAIVILQSQHRARAVEVAQHLHRQGELADRLLDVMTAHAVGKDAERLAGGAPDWCRLGGGGGWG